MVKRDGSTWRCETEKADDVDVARAVGLCSESTCTVRFRTSVVSYRPGGTSSGRFSVVLGRALFFPRRNKRDPSVKVLKNFEIISIRVGGKIVARAISVSTNSYYRTRGRANGRVANGRFRPRGIRLTTNIRMRNGVS